MLLSIFPEILSSPVECGYIGIQHKITLAFMAPRVSLNCIGKYVVGDIWKKILDIKLSACTVPILRKIHTKNVLSGKNVQMLTMTILDDGIWCYFSFSIFFFLISNFCNFLPLNIKEQIVGRKTSSIFYKAKVSSTSENPLMQN